MRDASLVLADGLPLVVASRLFRRSLPERVAGSDLVPRLLASGKPLRVFLLGAAAGVADMAAERIRRNGRRSKSSARFRRRWDSKTMPPRTSEFWRRSRRLEPDLLVVGFGAPKQELWVHKNYRRLEAKVAVCAGATIDFLAGHRRRSPVWMRRAGLEWLHRVASEPRRLAGRYARDAWEFPQLLWREWRRLYS